MTHNTKETPGGIIESLVKINPWIEQDGKQDPVCYFCGDESLYWETENHKDDCPWVRAKAFLEESSQAQHEGTDTP